MTFDEHPHCSADVLERLRQIWAAALGVDEGIASDDDFFLLGGDSLSALRVVGDVRDHYRIPLDVRVLFEAPELGSFAAVVAAALSAQPTQ